MSVSTKELKKQVYQYIIDCIDGDNYDIPSDALITTEGRLRFLYQTFISEKGWHIKQLGEHKAFTDWIQGLPSAFAIEYTNYEILGLAKKWGSLPQNPTEAQEYKILNNYWNFITVKTFQLFRKFKVIK